MNLWAKLREKTSKLTEDSSMNENFLERNKKINVVVILLTFIVVTVLQLILIFNNNVWLDEVFTIQLVNKDFSEFWRIIVEDVHPPLYYLILKLVISVTGYNFHVLKFLSVLPMILTNTVIVRLVLKNEDVIKRRRTAILTSFLLVGSSLTTNFLYMALEVRMYSWAAFFVTISGIYGYKLLCESSRKNIAIFVLSSLGAALTHYFALIMECVIYLYLFIALLKKDKKNIKMIIAIILATVIGYSWWLPFGVKQFFSVSGGYNVSFDLADVEKYVQNIFGKDINVVLGDILLLWLMIIFIEKLVKLKQYKGEEKREIVFALCAVSLPIVIILIGTLFNILTTPIFRIRYMMPALGLFWIGITIILNYTKRRDIFVMIACIVLAYMTIVSYHAKFKNEFNTGAEKTSEFLSDRLSDKDVIISNNRGLYGRVLDYYFPDNEVEQYNKFRFDENDKVVWYFEDKTQKEEDKTKIENAGYSVEKVYTGSIDSHYYFVIYRLEKVNI